MDYTLDSDSSKQTFDSSEQNRQLALQLVEQASHEVLIASYDFDTRIYSNSEFVDALSALARKHRDARVNILVWNTTSAVKNGHRVIDLAQRLTSSIHIHEPDRVHKDFVESFMVVDGCAYLRRPVADRFEGEADFHAPLLARDLKERFMEMWERSTPSSEFRRLRI
ncbi:MAG: hypothetical protein OEZ16_02180 [Chromatiales bacterium]|nr:hypothetical protein [Chromatiales bacterium]